MQTRGVQVVVLLALIVGMLALPGLMRSVATDNSRENASIVKAGITADAQPNDRQDRVTAARLRRVIVKDETLSIYAHNVKIIVTQGNVTLEGPVHSVVERQELALDAATIVGAGRIVNRITVA